MVCSYDTVTTYCTFELSSYIVVKILLIVTIVAVYITNILVSFHYNGLLDLHFSIFTVV